MFARTPRLLLRPGWPEDAPALAAAIGDEAVVRNLSRAPWPYSLAHAEAWLARPREGALPSFVICAREDRATRLIGGIGLDHTPQQEVEIGYWLAPGGWNLGYATEAGLAVLGIARVPGIARLVSGHFIDNPASGRVLVKLGFAPTGELLPRTCLARGSKVATKLYALDL